MVKGVKHRNSADLLAGIIVLIVALGLLVAAVVAIKQFVPQSLQTGSQSTAATTAAPPKPTMPTLVPNPLPENDFTYTHNGYLTCLSAESWLGVDVSEHQGKINWDTVAQTDVEFAMVRMAYRGWGTEGVVRADARGMENLEGAEEAGLLVGVYFFSQAITVEEAVEEARFLLQLLDGRKLDMPVVFDWETVSAENARTANMNVVTLNACAQAFCREIEAAGYDAMVYFNLDMAKWKYDLLGLQEAGYDFWLALYSDRLSFRHKVQMWQYTSSGSVAGIQGKVDLNLYFPQ